MAADAAEAGARPQQRLHPWSWLFVLLAQLRSFALPLFALLVFGRSGESWEFYGAAGGGVLALLSVVQYFSYRYGVIGSDLVIRAGILQRNTRSIPLARIRNVTLHRTLLHRLFGVAEVRLESAGGVNAEAQMRVLSLAAAAELERLVEGADPGAADAAADAPAARGETLLALSLPELVRLGLISNRGMVVVGAGFAGVWQLAPEDAGDWMELVGRWLFGQASALELGTGAAVAAGALVLLALLVLVRLLSIALAILQFHGFTLRELRGAVSVESGLLTRVRGHAPVSKIQLWTLSETLLHRLLGRQSVKVETAVSVAANTGTRALHQLVPVGQPATVAAVLGRLAPQLRYRDFRWQPLHPSAWRRIAFWPTLLTLLATLLLGWRLGTPALALLLLLPWWLLRARRVAAASGWALDEGVVAWRSGWLDRHVSFAEVAKLQGVLLQQSPFDRRHGMATVMVDTAGAQALGHRIDMHYLPEEVARRLAAELGARVARSPLAW